MSSSLDDTTRYWLYLPGFIICTIIPVSWGSGFKFHKWGVVWRSFFSASLSFRLEKQYSWYELDWLKTESFTESTASPCRVKWRVPLSCWVVHSISAVYYTVQDDSNFWACGRNPTKSINVWPPSKSVKATLVCILFSTWRLQYDETLCPVFMLSFQYLITTLKRNIYASCRWWFGASYTLASWLDSATRSSQFLLMSSVARSVWAIFR